MNPLVGIAIVLGALGVLIAGVKALRARGAVGAETARKLVHLGMGTICLTFPWIFREIWPVWTLAGLACLVLGALRCVPFLRREVGGVLHDVGRTSFGEIYFPLGVALVFTLSGGDALRFAIPVALLTFADAAGALVGKRWGRIKFATLEGQKSVEGSLAVGATGFICSAIPLLIAGHDWRVCVVIGAAIGLFSLILEAISWHGLDNIFLPLAGYTQVTVYLETPLELLLVKLAVLVALTTVALGWRRGQVVDDSARLGGTLALYFFWSVGGWIWLTAPLVLLASYVRLMPKVPGGVPRHNLVAVICVGSAGVVWCVANVFLPHAFWLWMFTLGIMTHQAVIAIVRCSQGWPQGSRGAWWLFGVVQAVALQGLVFYAIDRGQTVSAPTILLGGGCVAAAAAGFVLCERELQIPEDLNERWFKQGVAAVIAPGCAWAISTL